MRKAFTLLELLVTVVIIGIILAILLPTMGRVRGGARRVQCMNNLRQHGIAWYLYLDDHDEFFPAYGVIPLLGGADYSSFGGKQGSHYAVNYGAQYRVLNRYLDIYSEDDKGALEIFHCPDDIKDIGVNPPQTSFDFNGNSYNFNGSILAYVLPTGFRLRPLSTITSPRNKVYLEMCAQSNNPGHGGKGNTLPANPVSVMVLFVDGHVAGPFLYGDDFDSDPNTDRPVINDPNGPDAP